MSLTKISATAANILPESSYDTGDNAVDETNSNCSTDSDNNEETQRPTLEFQELNENEIPTFAIRMLNLCREIAIVCLLMITYAALTKDPPKISKAPAAYPFFPKDSIVTDWYRGQISKAIENARSSDIAFVMFYAPWDAESQAARQEFEATAKYMSEYVTFVAVNCWQPNSECRNQYSKVYRWPVLIAYPSHGRGVQYNGPISAPHMINFLQKVCNPILRLSEEHPIEFEDAYLIVNVNTSPGSLDFAVLYTTALKYLEKDPLQSISFYVHPTPTPEPLLYLHLWNETLVYPVQEKGWRPDEILQWLFKSFHQVTAWVAPVGSKSLILSNSIQEGPSLILFTPKNPLQVITDYYKMLQEIAHKYYSCEDNLLISLHNINIKLHRSANILRYNNLKAKCISEKDVSKRKITSHLNRQIWANYSHCHQKQGNDKDCTLLNHKINEFCSDLQHNECVEPGPEYLEKICDGKVQSVYKTSILTGENDERSPSNLLKLWRRNKCREFVFAETIQPAIFEKKIENERKDHNISGLACRTNKSLTFVAMDSLLFYHFAERLGIDVTSSKDKSAVAIINEKMESHYILQGPINTLTLSDFILKFTNNRLSRSLNSVTTLKSAQNLSHKTKIGKPEDKEKVFIKELKTGSFLPTVLQEDKAVVVFYYSKQCTFCSGISYALLTVAKKLSPVENLLFARVDGDVNILPWEYTMDTYPTILFFPAREKSESRVFPVNIPVTVPNLIGFILTNLDQARKLHAMWAICNQIKFEEERLNCFHTLQGETLAMIDKTLRDWRRSNKRQKQVLLHRLRHLRQLHFLFAHSPRNQIPVENSLKKLNVKPSHSKDYSLKDEL